jgi:hypothetical protein
MSGQFCTFHDSSEQILGSEAKFSNPPRRDEPLSIKGRKDQWAWEGEDDANVNEWEAFVASLKQGKPRADAQHGAEGTFTTILGREAAYRCEELTWKQLWDENQRLERRAYPVG